MKTYEVHLHIVYASVRKVKAKSPEEALAKALEADEVDRYQVDSPAWDDYDVYENNSTSDGKIVLTCRDGIMEVSS